MKSAGMIVVMLLCLGYASGAQSASTSPATAASQNGTKTLPRPNFNGRWEGVQVVQSDMPRAVADVVITIRDAAGKLSGNAMFYGRMRQGKGKWIPVEKFGSPLLSPRVEGKVLTFTLSFRTRVGEEKSMDYKMVMVGPDQAIFDYVEATMTDMSAKMTRKRK
jgi:hypothetical protein